MDRIPIGIALVALVGCPGPPRIHERSTSASTSDAPPALDAFVPSAQTTDAAPADARTAAAEDPLPLPPQSPLEWMQLAMGADAADAGMSAAGLGALFGVVPGRFNAGNKALARHTIGRGACFAGLHGIVIQTPEQRAACHGRDNMVPVYRGGDPSVAKACIDVFEFPDRPCELPAVWGTPSEAAHVCAAEGKRLCTQAEWTLACTADPRGGADSTYAYGNDLDPAICNTDKPHPKDRDGAWLCNEHDAETAWATCATETEPSGAFPRCRSRLGVFDLHGNVAEMMTRRGADGVVYSQLKGSAFFYVDVTRKPKEPQKPGGRESYPDHCAFDPRWHVEPLDRAVHSNYHLGFRCCLSL